VNGVMAVFWREMIILRRRIKRMLASYAISPTLFLIAFGWGVGRDLSLDGVDYITFMIPGLLALSSMSQSFSLAQDLNIARFYWMTFEEFQTAPIKPWSIVMGEIMSGMVRGLLSTVVIGILAALAGANINWSLALLIGLLLNTLIFSAAAVMAAMAVKSHADQSFLNSFIIVPMSFLCGTFFPLDRLPVWAKAVVQVLPLTHGAEIIRAAALDRSLPLISLAVMILYAAIFVCGATFLVKRAGD
jgi:ABC-2 type transport system permease protein